MRSRTILPQALSFVLVGLGCAVIDYSLYRACLLAALGVAPSKAIGFVVGTCFAYVGNRWWTFQARGRQARVVSFALVYGATFAMNVGANSAAVRLLGRGSVRLTIAFVIATTMSATMNFLGMRYVVFPPREW